jgi:hypothetical protein
MALVKTVMNIGFHKILGRFLNNIATGGFSIKAQMHGFNHIRVVHLYFCACSCINVYCKLLDSLWQKLPYVFRVTCEGFQFLELECLGTLVLRGAGNI